MCVCVVMSYLVYYRPLSTGQWDHRSGRVVYTHEGGMPGRHRSCLELSYVTTTANLIMRIAHCALPDAGTLGSRGLDSSGGHQETAMGKPRRPCGERRYPPKCPLFCSQESGGRVRVAVHAHVSCFLEKIASYFFETGFQGLE